MKTKFVFAFLLCFLGIIIDSCNSSKLSYEKKKEITIKITNAVKNAEIRSEENKKQFMEILYRKDEINEFSEELINKLLESGYIEADINRLFEVEIEKIFVKEILNRKWELFETLSQVFKIDDVKYSFYYLWENEENLPNLFTDVYVYNPERKHIQVFYKVNYDLEYKKLTDGTNYYKVYY